MPEVVTDEYEHVRDLLPEGAIPVQRFRVVAWLDPETGEMEHEMDWSEDCPLATSLGILEVIKHDMLTSVDEEDED